MGPRCTLIRPNQILSYPHWAYESDQRGDLNMITVISHFGSSEIPEGGGGGGRINFHILGYKICNFCLKNELLGLLIVAFNNFWL